MRAAPRKYYHRHYSLEGVVGVGTDMARSSEKATKQQVSRPKAPGSKRSGPAARAAKPAGAGSANPAKGKKRTDGAAKTKKAARTALPSKKPAIVKKAAPALKAPAPAKATTAVPAPKPAVLKKPQAVPASKAAVSKKLPAAPQQPSAPPEQRRKVVAAKPLPPPPPPAVDKQAEQAAKAERQLELRQSEYYEKAVEYFNTRKFSRALPLLEKAAEGPNATLRHRAHVYADICSRQISNEKVELKTADDHYNYGVKLMNDRRLAEAEQHLQRALRLAPKAGHVLYANAVLSALQGNAESAFGNLKRAIEIDPLNRVLALNDADLGSVLGHPPIAQLLHQGGDS